MALQSMGDMALVSLLRTKSASTKMQVARLTEELASGITQDRAAAVRYDFAALAGIERSIAMADSYRTSASEAGLFLVGVQGVLDQAKTQAEEVTAVLMVSVNAGTQTSIDATRSETEARFRATVAAFNQTVAGRSLFAGSATDSAALATPQAILDALQPLAAAATTAAEWQTALDAWFGPGGDFETVGYLGSDVPLNGFLAGDTERVKMDITAENDAIRDTLKAMTSVALLNQTGFASNLEEQRAVLQTTLDGMLSAQGRVTSLMAEVGAAQATIEAADVRLAAEKSALELARNDLLAVDPYDTATRFEEANRQLESLYMITARISRLNLSDYL